MRTLRFSIIKLLNEQKQQKIYKTMHKNAKYRYESVGWLSDERQNIRFEKLIDGLELEGKKILDVGCGLGAFCGYLRQKGINCDYTGIDIVNSFVKKAAAEYPDATFLHTSILDFNGDFDYVFSSGVYAFCSRELFFECVKKSLELAVREYRFNMLINAKGDGYFRFSPHELSVFLPQFECDSSIVGEYLENDITVYMSKKNK